MRAIAPGPMAHSGPGLLLALVRFGITQRFICL